MPRPSTFSKALASLGQFNDWLRSFTLPLHSKFDMRFRALSDALIVGEHRSESVYPVVTTLSGALALLFPAALTGLVINGTGLLNGATKATGATTLSTGKVTFTSVLPGERSVDAGSRITVTIEDDGDPLAVSVNTTTRVITITHDGATAAEIVAAIAAHATAKYFVTAAATTAGAIDEDETVYVQNDYRAGVLGDLRIGAVTLNGATSGCGVTSWTDTAITFDFNAAALTVGSAVYMRLRANNLCIAQLPLQVSNVVTFTVSIAAESGNARTATITVKDLAGNTVAAAVGLWITVRRAVGTYAAPSVIATTDGGAGSLAAGYTGPVLFTTNSSGVAEVTFTDPAGTLAETTRLCVRAATLPSTEVITDMVFA